MLSDIRERDARFREEMLEVNRVDVWPASDFDRSRLLKLSDMMLQLLNSADNLLHEYIDTLEKRSMTRCYAGRKCRKDIQEMLEECRK